MLVSSYLNDNETQLLFRSIAGAYFKNQRIIKNLSLGEASRSLHLNKGFLSDLEHGNRHFPDGIIFQLNDFYSCLFNDSTSIKKDTEDKLSNAYNYLFQRQTSKENNILKESMAEKNTYENSYAFFTCKILELFYHLRVSHDSDSVVKCKTFLDDYIYALSNYEKAIYFSLLALFYKRNHSTAKLAHDYIELSNSFCSKDSIIFAMNCFQEIAILGEMNRPVLALLMCQKVKVILKELNNYKRLSDIDLFEGNCLVLLGEQEEAQARLKSILELKNNELSSNTSATIQSLAFSFIIDHKYQECIEIVKTLKNNLTDDMQWYIPFCLYQLNDFYECEESIKRVYVNSTDINKHFLLAIQYRIHDDIHKFIEEIKYFYYSTLNKSSYDNVPIILNFILDFVQEKNDQSLLIKVLLDLNKYHENNLTSTNSELLK